MTIFRRSETREGMELLANVTFATGSIADPPSACVRIIAPLYPDVIQMNVSLPDALFSLDDAASSLARQCVDIAWRNDIEPFYRKYRQWADAGEPMDWINVFYRHHPEIREVA